MAVAFKHGDGFQYTYRDYLRMPDDGNRWEIIDGVPYMMAAPNTRHQELIGRVFNRLYNFLEGRRCRVFVSPFDVRMAVYDENDDDVINIVQPDIVVYCNQLGVDAKGGRAAPDIAIEILSPSSTKMDRFRKFRLYEKAGVKEYWIIDGENEFVEVYIHDGSKFLAKTDYAENDIITSTVLEGFKIEASDIFFTPDEN